MMMEASLKIIGHSSTQRTQQYATRADFCRIFVEDMKNLYFLSLVLTADPQKAESCFVSGLDDCATGNQVFGEWARSWARRVVIKNAVRMIAPEPGPGHRLPNMRIAKDAKPWTVERMHLASMEISAVLGLGDFERFAFVMSVLEDYSDQDCALLLGCNRESLIAARLNALRQLGESAESSGLREEVNSMRRGAVEDEDRVPLATPA
jgi:hypothetical protein